MTDNSGQVVAPAGQEEAEERSWLELDRSVFIKTAVLALGIWYYFGVEIEKIVHRWVTDSSWSHGFLIPLFSLYFLHQNKNQILQLQPKTNYLGLFALIACIALYPLNIVHIKVAYLNPLLVIATIGATVFFLGSWKLVKYTWLPIIYLFFAVPLPGRLYREITIPMRILAAKVATFVLNLIPDLQAAASGVVIDVMYKGKPLEPALDVAEACSGMRLLMAFLALGVAMAYLHYRPIWQRLVLLASTIPIAILCNVIRVTITGFIYIFGDPKYAQGIYHDMLGMAMLPLAFGFYGGLAWFMANLFVEDKPIEQDVIVRKETADNVSND